MMNDLRMVVPALILFVLATSGCIDINDPGCTSDEDCRLDRVCSAAGVCESSERAGLDDTGNADAGEDTTREDTAEEDVDDPDTEPIEVQSMRVYDDCDDDVHITRISLSPEPFPACDSVVSERIDINIEGALDLNQQQPGSVEFDRFTGGIQVLGCEGSFCVNADSGVINLEFYEPGEVVSGTYEFQMQSDPEISDAISGQTFQGSFDNVDLNWCSFADQECRF
jgi:hypothetical protein